MHEKIDKIMDHLEHLPDSVVAAPPAGVITSHFLLDIPLEDWVLWLNLAYILLAIAWKLWTIWRDTHGDS